MNSRKTTLLAMIGIVLNVSCTRTITQSGGNESIISAIALADSVSKKQDLVPGDSLPPAKYIYLTIDDAPLNGSRYIDSIVFKTRVKTSIFMVGNPIHGSLRFERYHKMLKKNPYIELYNHSYSHANHRYASYYKNPEQVVADFERNQSEFNLVTRIARLPGRNLWQLGERTKNYKQTGAEAAAQLSEKGYKVFGWDVEWKYNTTDYAPAQTVDELIMEIDSISHAGTFTPNHIVLLMHDQMFAKSNDKNNLETLIEKLKTAGYTFEYLRSYPELAEK